MKTCKVYFTGGKLAEKVEEADSFFTRLKGLMFRKTLEEGEGLLLRNCPAIHCCFMRFTIDVVYLDDLLNVIGVETVRPWQTGGRYKGTRHVLELRENACSGIYPGMRLAIKECAGL